MKTLNKILKTSLTLCIPFMVFSTGANAINYEDSLYDEQSEALFNTDKSDCFSQNVTLSTTFTNHNYDMVWQIEQFDPDYGWDTYKDSYSDSNDGKASLYLPQGEYRLKMTNVDSKKPNKVHVHSFNLKDSHGRDILSEENHQFIYAEPLIKEFCTQYIPYCNGNVCDG